MHAAEEKSPHAAAWIVEPDHASASLRARKGFRARRDDATSTRTVIVSSLFLVLFTTGLLIGGHVAIDPLLHKATAASDSESVGDLIYPMPDGKYCRHMSFDNATSDMIEGTVEPCPDNIVGGQSRRTGRGFSWGEH